MRDNWIIIYKTKGKTYREFCSSQRMMTIKGFADEIIKHEFIG